MGVVIGVFANAAELQDALERLDEAGFRDEIVREEPTDDDASAPRESDLGLAPGANQAGALAELRPSSDLESFDLDDDEHAFLQRALDRGAELVAIRTDRAGEAAAVLREAGAQQVREPG